MSEQENGKKAEKSSEPKQAKKPKKSSKPTNGKKEKSAELNIPDGTVLLSTQVAIALMSLAVIVGWYFIYCVVGALGYRS